MSPRSSSKPGGTGPKPPPPWRREAAGVYRSADDRFTIEGDGAGRWFVRDSSEHDELGLERTIGPFGTLDAAKEDATERRDRGPERSPLEARLERAERGTAARAKAERPTAERARGTAAGPKRRAAGREARRGGAGAADHRREREAAPAARRTPSRLEPPTRPPWLDRLEATDAGAARLARRRVTSLGRLGIDDAEAVVRRDVEADEPAIAERLLELEVARAVADSLGGDAIRQAARAAGLGDEGSGSDAARRFATTLAERVAAAAVAAVAGREHATGADPDLPGWQLVEIDRELPNRRRRIRM